MRHYILDGHTPVPASDALAWAAWFETSYPARRVAEDVVNGVRVSTVFLGLNHQWGKGPPLLFETMTFGDGDKADRQWRHSTWEEAETGHAVVVAWLRGQGDEP